MPADSWPASREASASSFSAQPQGWSHSSANWGPVRKATPNQNHNYQQESWCCGFCGVYTWKPKMKCRSCGLRKSWGQAQAPPTAPAPASPAASINTCIDLVAAKVENVTAQAAADMSTAPRPAEQPTKAQMNANIKALEAALHQLPADAGNQQTRDHLIERINAEKRAIMKAKPLGAQLDGCRSALDRAEKRREQAREALRLATDTLEAADAEVNRLHDEKIELEKMVAMQAPSAREDGRHAGASPSDSIENMIASLQNVLKEMKDARTVPDEYINETEQQMSLLLTGVQKIALHAKQNAAAAPMAPSAASPASAAQTPPPRALTRSATDPDPAIGPTRMKLAAKTRVENTPYGAGDKTECEVGLLPPNGAGSAAMAGA